MKQVDRKLFALIIAILLFVTACFSANSLTVYEDGQYLYVETEDNSFVSLYGWNVSTPDELTVMDNSIGRYVISIYEYAFFEDENVTNIDFSNARHLEYIDSRAFSGCSVTGEIILPSSLKALGYAAFQDCKKLYSVSGGNRLTEIPAQCYYGCSSLSSVKLSRNIEKIGKLAFANCPSLKYIFIPESINDISNNAFSGSYNVVINCYYGSYAHQYAKDNNIPYAFLDDYAPGDVNLDGVTDVTDATYVQQYAADLSEFNELQLSLADLTKDGVVDISDATSIQRLAAGLE